MAHLKRLNAHSSWPIHRKSRTFIMRPSPGTHKQDACVPLVVVLRDMAQIAKTTREVRNTLRHGQVLVDGIARKDVHFPVGVMDTVSIPPIKTAWRLLYDKKGRFTIHAISTERAAEKTRKIVAKHMLPKKRLQLNFHDGFNLIVDKDVYKTGDSLVMADKKVHKHLKFEGGATVYLIGGKHIGETGTIKEIKNFKGMEKNRIVLEIGENTVETLKDYAFVVDPKEMK